MSGVTQLVTSGPLILALPVAAAAGAVTFLSPGRSRRAEPWTRTGPAGPG
jgi:hypothetical protein